MQEDINILIEGCKAYNRLSQEKLYRLLYPELIKLCKKFFDDTHDIKTALNNGMLEVFNHIEEYNPAKGDLIGWVYTIVRNAAISVIRNKSNKSILKVTYLHDNFDVEDNQYNTVTETHKEQIIQYLHSLTTTTRAVLNLFYLEGFLIKEIAMCLDMKEGTVKWHLNEGRNKLKHIFNNEVNNITYAK